MKNWNHSRAVLTLIIVGAFLQGCKKANISQNIKPASNGVDSIFRTSPVIGKWEFTVQTDIKLVYGMMDYFLTNTPGKDTFLSELSDFDYYYFNPVTFYKNGTFTGYLNTIKHTGLQQNSDTVKYTGVWQISDTVLFLTQCNTEFKDKTGGNIPICYWFMRGNIDKELRLITPYVFIPEECSNMGMYHKVEFDYTKSN